MITASGVTLAIDAAKVVKFLSCGCKYLIRYLKNFATRDAGMPVPGSIAPDYGS